MLKIEFFHDVICSFCFPNVCKNAQGCKDLIILRINHLSFALAWSEEDFIRQFGSREAVKQKY